MDSSGWHPAGRAGRVLRGLLALCVLSLAACATPRSLDGRVVVVTGASSGFGKGVALRAAEEGASVVLAARREALLDALERDIVARGGSALAVPTDVADPAQVERLAAAALARYGRIDVWINNAGVGALGAFDAVPLADHLRVLEVNLDGVVAGSHVALRQFRRQGAGTLINVASVAGRIPFPYYASYAASKHGVLGLGLTLHQELRLQGLRDIRVSTILPFAADTPWFDHAANYSGRRPRMVLMDPPEKVVDAIVGAIHRPRKQISVGYKARLGVFAHAVAPGPTQRLAASVVHRVQIENAPPAEDGSGSLHVPMQEGTGVDGGVRARMREERRRDEAPAHPDRDGR
ncbi:SDR family NAD(P)-dependent oxidoreductase [Coralloluteibacterium thermophilus]|uniref:SDR family NAD(P)-dependent oxidoreductase n=1 Tax=Coralloluteibacterium thermophilum TaxID=2707049 RepID=A0ABV9NI74_9GAMM